MLGQGWLKHSDHRIPENGLGKQYILSATETYWRQFDSVRRAASEKLSAVQAARYGEAVLGLVEAAGFNSGSIERERADSDYRGMALKIGETLNLAELGFDWLEGEPGARLLIASDAAQQIDPRIRDVGPDSLH